MGTIADPFSGLIQGVLQGHAIATQLRNQAMQEESFQRAKQRDLDEQQIRHLTLQQQLVNTGATRVEPGSTAVTDSFTPPSPSAIPGVPDTTSQPVTFTRPVDKSRMVSLKHPVTGETTQWELPSLEQQVARQIATKRAEGMAGAEGGAYADVYKRQALQTYLENERQSRGMIVPDIVSRAGLAAPGDKRLPEEMQGLIEAAQKILTPEYKEVGAGGTMMEMPRMGIGAGTGQQPQQQPQQPQQPQGDLSQTGLPPAVMPGISTPGRTSTIPGGALIPGLNVAPQAENPIVAAAAPLLQKRQQFIDAAKNAGQPTTAAATTPATTPTTTPTTTQPPVQQGPRPIFTAGQKPTGDFQMVFLPAFAKSLGKTVDQLTPEETMRATTEYSRRSDNPTKIAMERARLAIEQDRLKLERRNAGFDENGRPVQYADAQGNPINISPMARQIAAYKLAPLSARAYTNNRGLMNEVLAANPNFDVGQYEQRYQTFKDLGPGGKLGQTNLALNTLVRHSDDMYDAIAGLGNGSFTPANAGYQKIRQLFGSSAPTNFDQLKQYVVGETVKLIRGGGGTNADEERAAGVLNRAGSPQQLADAMRINFEVAGGKMQAQNEAVRKAINDPGYTSLDSGARDIMIKHGFDPETFKPAISTGKVHFVDAGQDYDIPAGQVRQFLADHPRAKQGN